MPENGPLPLSVELAVAPFGIRADSAEALSGYHDEGYLIRSAAETFVLKIAPPETPAEVIDFEAAVVEHVLSIHPELPIPRYHRSDDGTAYARVDIDGVSRHARLMDFARGVHYAEFRPHTRKLREDLGRLLGTLDAALLSFGHPAMNRYFEWDLAHALDSGHLTAHIADAVRRKQVEGIFLDLAGEVQASLAAVRKSVIHSDANDYNLMVGCRPADGAPEITGLLDFGDTVYTHTVNELAIACAYAMMAEDNPIAAACDVIRGYNGKLELQEAEVEVLYPLIRTRLAVSTVLSARWKSQNPNAESTAYHTVSQQAVGKLLDQLESVNARFAHYAFRDACGMEGCPQTSDVVCHLDGIRTVPVIPDHLLSGTTCRIDLSVGSTQPAARFPEASVEIWSQLVVDQIREAGARMGVGRYDEARACYTSSQFQTQSGEPRTVHLGLDLFVPSGTPVFAPLAGTVRSLRDNDLPLDYGPTIILEHPLPGELSCFSLYGHLGRECLNSIKPGQSVSQGEQIGTVGESGENGGWPPHLHLQVVTDLLDFEGNFPGVAQASARSLWTSLCPNPNLIAGLPTAALKTDTLPTESVAQKRRDLFGGNLSLSYRKPLHIVRGRGQYLFDVNGHRYLDCVNNVAHVGHGHPRVVAAIADQAAVLNTNTRYLHENLVRYAEELLSTLPDPLRVCYFVNSGSEANDLALRMALTHTGGTDFVVLGAAYHGHLTNLIDVSPYKSSGPGGLGSPSNVHELAAPDMFRGPHADVANPVEYYSDEMERRLGTVRRGGHRIAAFIAESALSCAGQIILPPGYLRSMYEPVRREGGVCIADEVQIGFGRVGTHFWAFETQEVIPDIVTMGKPIGNGHPLGAVVTTRSIADSFANGMEYFNTYGGNPVSCAAGLAVLEVIRTERLQESAFRVGRSLIDTLRSLAANQPLIGDVRGQGLFVGIEIVRPGTREPDGRMADYVVGRMRDKGILLSTDGPDHNVIKIKPPMVFSHDNVVTLADALAEVLRDTFVQSAVSRAERC